MNCTFMNPAILSGAFFYTFATKVVLLLLSVCLIIMFPQASMKDGQEDGHLSLFFDKPLRFMLL